MLDVTIVQNDDQYIHVYCTLCAKNVGPDLVPIGPLQQAFDILTEHNAEAHPS